MDPVRTGAGQFTLGKFDVGGTLLFPTGGSRGGRQTESKKDSRDGKNVNFIYWIYLPKKSSRPFVDFGAAG